MKRLFIFLGIILISATTFSQTPQSFKYQAIARGPGGELLSYQDVTFRITLLQGSANGSAVYAETHQATTNYFGLVNINIGEGTPVSGDFSAIDWSINNYFIQVEIDPAGGSFFLMMGTTQLLSVPYALHSKTAESFQTGEYADLNGKPELSFVNDSLIISSGGGSVYLGNYGNLIKIGADSTFLKGLIDQNAADITTEITNRTNADNNLQANIDAETLARQNADTDLNTEMDADSTYLKNLIDAGSSNISDSDNDTKILVEETTDEDSIKFVVNDTLRWIMTRNRLEAKNNGGSIYIGKDAGASDKLNYEKENVFVGINSGNANVSDDNVFIGSNSGRYSEKADQSVFIGTQSGMYSYSDYNTFIGFKSGKLNTLGNSNIFIGYETGQKNTEGDKNTFVGSDCGEYNTTGNENVSLGYNSGFNNSTGGGNVFLGFKAGYSELGSNKLYIENSNTSSPLIYGDFAADSLAINGTLTVTGGNPGLGKVLTSDANGFASWQATSSDAISDADNDTKIMVEETADEDSIKFVVNDTLRWNMVGSRIEPKNSGGSVIIGEGAGASDDFSNNQNVFIGKNSGKSEKNDNNVFIGAYSGKSTKGDDNVFIGSYSGENGVNAEENVFIGYQSGMNCNDDYNTFVGAFSGKQTTSGWRNTYLGYNSGENNTTGLGNLFVGYNSGRYNETGEKNIFLGYDAGFYEMGSEKLYIENSDSETPLIYGDFDADSLAINGTLTITGGNPGLGKVLTSDANGFASWQATSSDAISDADNDTKILVEETPDDDNINFTIQDTTRWQMNGNRLETTNADRSVFIGENVGNKGESNVFIGLESGTSNTDGDDNIFVGAWTGYSNTTGDNNIFLGVESGGNNTTGRKNFFGGYYSGGENTTGQKNIYLGFETAYSNTTGSGNTFIGHQSGYENNYGSYNVFLGYQAGTYAYGSNKLFIENSDSETPLIYGDFDKDSLVFNGDVTIPSGNTLTASKQGIGTNTPDASAALEIQSTTQGFLPPRMTEVERDAISSPAAGLMVWCTDCGTAGELQAYDGAAWQSLMGGSTGSTGGSDTTFTCGTSTIDDIDGNTYSTVEIGNQCWMGENLNVTKEPLGNSITRNCYDNNNANCNTYGGLYDWSTIMNGAASSSANPSGVQGICPDGWHVPSYDEWNELSTFLGGTSVAGGKIKETGTSHWNSPNTDATNSSGFSALPGGYLYNGNFSSMYSNGMWFTSTHIASYTAHAYFIRVSDNHGILDFIDNPKEIAYSVRCVKD